MKVVFSERADSDLLQIISYLAPRNMRAALALADAIDSKLSHLAQHPLIGRERSSLSPGLRSLVVQNYLVFYRVDEARITVIRVLDGRRDIESEFHE